MNKNYNIHGNKDYKSFSEKMEMNTKKKQLPFSQFSLRKLLKIFTSVPYHETL